MKKSAFFLCVFILVSWVCLWANSANNENGQFFRVYFKDKVMARLAMERFEAGAMEISYTDKYLVMLLTPEEYDELSGLNYTLVPCPDYDVHHSRCPNITREGTIPGYPSYRLVEKTFEIADSICKALPKLGRIVDAGDSWEKTQGIGGYDHKVLILTNADIPGPKPKLFVTGAIHAREYATSELALRFVYYLIKNYGKDADATWMLDHHEYHAMFYINPDGRKHAEKGEMWRKTTNTDYCKSTPSKRGVDLNRNSEYSWGTMGSSDECNETFWGPKAASEPEMQAVQKYQDQIFNTTPKLGGVYIDMHCYGEIIYKPSAVATLARKFSYFNGYDAVTTRGGQAYEYAFYKAGVAAGCLFELGTKFFQDTTYFEQTIVPKNLQALIYALKACRDPLKIAEGPDAITLSITNKVLKATIDDTRYGQTVETQNIAGAEYYISTPPWISGATPIAMTATDGAFDEKSEEVTATLSPEYLNDKAQVTIYVRGKDASGNWGAVSAIFYNQPNAVIPANELKAPITFTFPHPLIPPATIRLQLPHAANIQIRVCDLKGKSVATVLNQTLGTGAHSLQWDGKNNAGNALPYGMYVFELRAANSVWAEKFIMVK